MPGLPLPTPPLRDDVVALRPWQRSDVPVLVAAFGDPVIERFSWPHAGAYTEADALAYVAGQAGGGPDGEQREFAAVAPADDALVLGGASLYDVELEQRRGAVGYWLAPGARGRGVATHAVRLIAAWAFDHLHLARLTLTCGPDNRASQRVAERCGFTREGLLRSHMEFKHGRRDTVVYGLLPGELR